MGIAAIELCRHVIRPTLIYLDRQNTCAEWLLLGIAASQSSLGAELDSRCGYGLYGIPELRHRFIWDNYLALDPELASRVRGLASQHAFLSSPHLELMVNLRYSTAIAWLLIEACDHSLPTDGDSLAMARIWRTVFQPQGRLQDFVDAWNTSVAPLHALAWA